jgi:hypothetical protein
MKALNEQIYHYNIHTSLFDVVLAAVCRFVVLLLFYGLIYMNHWFIVSVSYKNYNFNKCYIYVFVDINDPNLRLSHFKSFRVRRKTSMFFYVAMSKLEFPVAPFGPTRI